MPDTYGVSNAQSGARSTRTCLRHGRRCRGAGLSCAAGQDSRPDLAGRIRRIRYAANFARKRERWGEAMREHETILDALRRRAGSELSDILFKHLRNKQTAAVDHLKQDASVPAEPG